MKITYLDEAAVNLNGDIDYSQLHGLGEFVVYDNTHSQEETISRLAGSEVAIVNKVDVNADIIAALPELKYVVVSATGYNHIDLASCSAAGIKVSNVPGYSTSSVAQHVMTLILNLATRIHDYNQAVKSGEWQQSDLFTLLKYPTFELRGKVLGTIGFGAIGSEVARLAAAFGMTVLVHRRSSLPVETYQSVSLDELLASADVVTLNCPLTSENQYMIDQSALQKMKNSALLINTARGALVNQNDLAEALKTGQIAGAGIDVLDLEPPTDNPLFEDIPNLILTPHSAWTTLQARQRLVNELGNNIAAYQRGEDKNVVN